MDSRVEDYLNDKFQVEADLDSLDVLLDTAKRQQALLKQQLDQANLDLQETSDVSAQHDLSLREDISTFDNRKTDIDQRLKLIIGADDIDDAVDLFMGSWEKLQTLDRATAYINILQEVDRLSTSARSTLRTNPRDSTAKYSTLRSILEGLKIAQPAAEGAAPHLVDQVEQETRDLDEQMRNVFGEALQKTLDSMSWPKKDTNVDPSVLGQWAEQMGLLLSLQEPDFTLSHHKGTQSATSQDPIVLLPLQIMVHPLELRFRYHFNGDKPTNRLDKPEYFLSHINDLIEAYNDFMLEHLQTILDKYATNPGFQSNLAYTDATTAFITSLLPMVRQKCLSLLPQIADDTQLLSHFVHELMEFDATLRDAWSYTPTTTPSETWRGLTWEVLVTHGYFNIWLEAEKSFALDRYHAITSTADSGEIDFDTPLPGTTKPTKGAIRVNDLLETITDRYRPLSSFSQRLRFLIDIQLEIFDRYHIRLHESLEAYISLTSTLGRTMSGSASGDSSTDLSGIRGLERLCRVFGSAEYLERKMLDWSDDVFFLGMWEELQSRTKSNAGTNRSVARDMSVAHIASKTSSVMANGGSGQDTNGDAEDGALFDETASAYRRLRTRSEGIIIESMEAAIRTALKGYSKISTWATLTVTTVATGEAGGQAMSISPELNGPLQALDAQLGFLASVLSRTPLRRVTRQICLSLQAYIWDYVMMRNTFSVGGAAILHTDILAVCNTINQHVGAGIAESGMKRLREALALLCLSADGASTDTTEITGSAEAEDAWGFTEEDTGLEQPTGPRRELSDSDHSMDSAEVSKWGLWDVEKRVFKSNDSAREALRHLGLETLNEQDARGILGRRVELQT
ncbi:putative rint-1 family protein [Phaeomoniella chlamydospora]|uniref:Putative rint-1 family protein n=1 Tax=Phaeomoniella chlamydospora TaxID=158046 RepID=A0A0G2G972_PHACM|nr:putative rint-1 family protein [Phaeomoniella chlamydospora]